MRKTIVILHGWAYSTDKWEPLVKSLKKNFDVVFLAIPGLTESIDAPWTLNNYVDWLDKKIKPLKGDVVLLGHSNGGRISLAYLLKYPEKISHLVLIDSAGIYHNELHLRIKRKVFKHLAKAKHILRSSSLEKLLYKLAREQDYYRASPVTKETMKNLITVDLTPQLHLIKTPTTIIWGDKDITTPLSDGKLMNKKIPHSTLSIIVGARHSPQFTNVEKVVEIITSSVERTSKID